MKHFLLSRAGRDATLVLIDNAEGKRGGFSFKDAAKEFPLNFYDCKIWTSGHKHADGDSPRSVRWCCLTSRRRWWRAGRQTSRSLYSSCWGYLDHTNTHTVRFFPFFHWKQKMHFDDVMEQCGIMGVDVLFFLMLCFLADHLMFPRKLKRQMIQRRAGNILQDVSTELNNI